MIVPNISPTAERSLPFPLSLLAGSHATLRRKRRTVAVAPFRSPANPTTSESYTRHILLSALVESVPHQTNIDGVTCVLNSTPPSLFFHPSRQVLCTAEHMWLQRHRVQSSRGLVDCDWHRRCGMRVGGHEWQQFVCICRRFAEWLPRNRMHDQRGPPQLRHTQRLVEQAIVLGDG